MIFGMTPLEFIGLYTLITVCVGAIMLFPDSDHAAATLLLPDEGSVSLPVVWSAALVWPLTISVFGFYLAAIALRLLGRSILVAIRSWV